MTTVITKNCLCFFELIYKIVTIVHSKTVPQNVCRKKQISLPDYKIDYKIVTVSHFKMISHNRLKICIVKLSFFSSIKEAYLPGGHIHKRLDRCMTNVDWCILFPHALAELLLSSNSDHNLIMLSCSKSRTKRLKSFYLQAAWSMHCDYGSIV